MLYSLPLKILSFILIPLMLSFSCISNAQTPPDQIPEGGFGVIKWDHPNVSGWPVTSTLSSVSVDDINNPDAFINLPYDKSSTWRSGTGLYAGGVVANSWVILKYNGRWIASTWDFMRPGQTSKFVHAVGGGAIPSVPSNWHPKQGEEVYFFISGLIRYGVSGGNVRERSNIIRYRWGDPLTLAPTGQEPELELEKTPIMAPINTLLIQ